MSTNNFSASVSLNTGQSNKSVRALTDNVQKLSKGLDELNKSIQDSNGNMDSLADSFRATADATREAVKASQELTTQRKQESGAAEQSAKAEKGTADAYKQSAKATSDAGKAAGKAAQGSRDAADGAREMGSATQDVISATQAARDGTERYSESLASHRYLMYDVGDTYRTMSVALAAIPAATSAMAIAYEKDMAQIERTTGLAGDAANDYQRQLKNLATEIPVTFSELTEITKIGGQMGVAEGALASFTETVARFVETSQGVNIDSASTAFGRLENMFNRTPSGALADPQFFERIGSAIAYTGDNSVATEQQIIAMLEKTTASAKNAGLTIQETIAMSSAMVSSGLQPFLSSGFIIRFFGNFQKAAAEGGTELESLSRTLGVTSAEFQNLVRNDPYELLYRVVSAMKDMDSVQSKQFLQQLGINGVQDPKVLNALSENLHVLEGAMGDVTEAYAEADYLDRSSEGIFGTTAANIQMFTNSLMNLGATIGSSGLPVFANLLQAATGLVSGLDDLISSSIAAKTAIGILLAAMTAMAGIAAFRSTLSFVNAGLVMFRDAAQKGALSGGRFGGITRQLSEIALLNKGATDQQVQAMMRGRTTSEAFRIALAAQRSELQKLTGVQQAHIAGISAQNAAIRTNMTTHQMNTLTIDRTRVATYNLGTAVRQSASSYANSAAQASVWRTALGSVQSVLGGLLNPATLVTGAVIGLGSAWFNAKQEADTFSQSVGEQIPLMGELEGAVDAALKKMSEYEFGWADAFLRGTAGIKDIGKDFLEVAENAGISGERIRTAFEGGKEGIAAFKRELEDVWDAANRGEGDLTIDQMDHLYTVIQQLEEFINEAEEAEDAQKRLAEAGVEAGEGMVEGAMGADEMADAMEGGADSALTFEQSISDALDAVFGFVNAEGAMTTALENMGKGLAESTDMSSATSEGVANIENFQRVVSSSLSMLEQQLTDGTFASVQEATAYYTEFFQGLGDQMVQMGVDPAQAQQMVDLALQSMQATLGAEGNNLVAELGLDPLPAYYELDDTVTNMDQIINEVPFEFHLDADGQPATDTTWEVVNWIAEAMGITPEAVLDAVDGNATENTAAVWEYIMAVMHDEYVAYLNADASGGTGTVADFYNWSMARLEEISSGINSAGMDLNSLIETAQETGVGIARQIMRNPSGFTRFSNAGGMRTDAPTISSFRSQAPSAPKVSAPSMASSPSIPQPDFSALNRGYNDAAKAARNAGGAGRKAGNNAAKGAKKAGKAAKGAGKAAKKAGGAAKKAGKDGETAAERAARAAREWNKAYQDLQSWAGRVGEALTMAFDQKHAVQSAKDQYYTVLNGINDRLDQQKQRVKELREETKRLTAERKVELNEAQKYERMAEMAAKHGNIDRAQDYRDQAKAMRERAKEMSSSISANKAEQSTIQAGIGNLKGYSQAAIDNRAELRQLEQAALKIPQAYASIGASATTVAAQTRKWTGNVRTHARELGYTNSQVRNNTTATSRYIAELNRVPRNIPTVVRASHSGVPGVNRALNNVSRPRNAPMHAHTRNTSPTNRALNNLARLRNTPAHAHTRNTGPTDRALNNLARNRTVALRVVAHVMSSARKLMRGGIQGFLQGRFYTGGPVPAFNSGGLIPGRSPADPREDNLLASVDGRGLIAVRSNEYIQPEPAVKYYGQDFMEDIRQLRLPKYWGGGSVGGSSGGGNNNGVVELSAKSINMLAKNISSTVVLEVSRERLAEATSKGQMVNNQKRGIFRDV